MSCRDSSVVPFLPSRLRLIGKIPARGTSGEILSQFGQRAKAEHLDDPLCHLEPQVHFAFSCHYCYNGSQEHGTVSLIQPEAVTAPIRSRKRPY